MFMRDGSNLQEFVIEFWENYIDLPTISIFTTYKPGITNLRTLIVNLDLHYNISNTEYQNTIEFLNMVPKFCKDIVNCELWIPEFVKLSLDLIKLQPLKRMSVFNAKEVIHALEFR